MRRPSLLLTLQWSLVLTTLIFLLFPIFLSVVTGLMSNAAKGWRGGFTFRWLEEVWELYSTNIMLSLLIALTTLALALLVGVPASFFLLRQRGWGAKLFDELLLLPIAIPGLATALALISTYGSFPWLRRSWLFIVIGHLLYTLPFMIRAVLVVLKSLNYPRLEEAAASLGANAWQRFFGVMIPNVKTGLLNGSLMVLTLSLGEFNLTWMLHTPLTQTLPVGLADSYASMRLEVGSAYTLIFFLLILPFLLVTYVLVSKKQKAPLAKAGSS